MRRIGVCDALCDEVAAFVGVVVGDAAWLAAWVGVAVAGVGADAPGVAGEYLPAGGLPPGSPVSPLAGGAAALLGFAAVVIASALGRVLGAAGDGADAEAVASGHYGVTSGRTLRALLGGGVVESDKQVGPWWRRPIVIGVGALVVVGGVVGGVLAATSGPDDPGVFTLRGTFVIRSGATGAVDSPADGDCEGYDSAGTGDVVPGAPVSVYDAAGAPVGRGRLGKGTLPAGSDLSVPCSFSFVIPGVPAGSKSYAVEVTNRGRVAVTPAEARAGVAQSLG